MNIADLASDTWKFDLDEPTEISVAYVAQWYRVHIGDLNNLINNGYNINSSYQIVDDSGVAIDEDAASIFKKLFEITYFKKQSKLFLGANAVDVVNSVSQDGIVFKGLNRNEISKTYNELYKEAKNELKQLLNNFKYNRGRAAQIESDDKYSKFDIIE